MYTTRIAPSPTGMMHVGTARTALFNWLIARASGGHFILRLDDTDSARNQAAAEQPILDGLTWLGLGWDRFERQSARQATYESAAQGLVEHGLAHQADNGAILLRVQPDTPRSWTDEITGDIRISDRDIELMHDLPLLRGGDKLGQATYQFSSIVDDYLMDVNYVVRGTDHIANTAKQVAIWHCLNRLYRNDKVLPEFAHIGLIFKDKKKMSKRDGAASLLDYRDNGYDPDGMFNFLLRLGWGPKVDDKASTFMTRERATELFLDGGNMRSSNANFDSQKLDFYDRRYKQMKWKAENV